MQSTKSWVVRYFQKHETVKFSLLLRFVRDMDSFNVTSTLDHVLTASLPRSKNSRTWRGRGQIETISDF